MFAISWTLAIAAALALVGGIYQGGVALILLAVGGALAAGAILGVGVLRSGSPRPTTEPRPFGSGPEGEPAPAPPIVFMPPPDRPD